MRGEMREPENRRGMTEPEGKVPNRRGNWEVNRASGSGPGGPLRPGNLLCGRTVTEVRSEV